jgi:tetratricopeptide (TPR) repeat protein
MNDEPKSSQQRSHSSGSRDQVLAETLEDLVAKANSRAMMGEDLPKNFTSPAAGKCPETGDWIELAGGDISSEKKDALRAHAALCSACLTQLRQVQHALTGEVSPQESAELSHLASTSSQWQHRLAVELAHTPRETQRSHFLPRFVWLGTGLAAALVLILSVTVWWRRANSPERLLAEAYADARTSDLRVPGAGFAPVTPQTHLRGGTAEREPAPLLNARAQIERNLERTPNDPRWLQLQARAEILEERYDGAIDILDRLVAAGPVTASLLLDDGSAYFMRGTATGSENDRATALDELKRADELAPSDPVVLFNEALMMEDRGQMMNAVEVWNRYLKVERDPKWQDEGRRHLTTLQQKVDQLKTHESRMEQHLSSPQAMRALTADPALLAGIDEELSTTLLPRLLDAAFPLPVDRSRGSPCDENCLAARSLLNALAASLKKNHQDLWLQQFLPSDSSPIQNDFRDAAHALGRAIDADTRGDYATGESTAEASRDLFRKLGNRAGADRGEVERAFALQRLYKFAACHEAADPLLGLEQFGWIQAQAVALDAGCDVSPGTAASNNPRFERALSLARNHGYVLLELRARNMLGDLAMEAGDAEAAWREGIETLHRSYSGDYPPFRTATTVNGLAEIEDATPRARLDLLLNRETLKLYELSKNLALVANARMELIRAALRAGSMEEAETQLKLVRQEGRPVPRQESSLQAESESATARLYLHRGGVRMAESLLADAAKQMTGEDNPVLFRNYAVARGELQLASGDPETAETTLRTAILKEELEARGAGRQNIIFARQDRELYATLAGIWLSEKRDGTDILSLWERYRLRILGKPVPTCREKRLDCLAPQLTRRLQGLGDKRVLGQIALWDRILRYTADSKDVTWKQSLVTQEEALATAVRLERTVSFSGTSAASVEQASQRAGDEFFGNQMLSTDGGDLILEPDPLLGNLPWPAVEIAKEPLGLHYSIAESPSLLLDEENSKRIDAPGRLLVVGASEGAGEPTLLPEVLKEASTVSEFASKPELLLADQATEPHIVPLLSTAAVVHFAGHAAEFDGETRLLLAPSGKIGDQPYIDDAVLEKNPPRAARLVVFSACSTGKQEAGWDHGMGDLVETLASLGVPDVVATRWQIDSAAAVPMMDAFYQGLAHGLSVPRALTAARHSLIRDARYQHPYYWAAYYATGQGSTNLSEVFHEYNR